jgi:hypothetical protein
MKRLSEDEKRALLASKGERKVRAHKLTWRLLHWRACVYCRVLNLNNEPTRQHFRRPCVVYE